MADDCGDCDCPDCECDCDCCSFQCFENCCTGETVDIWCCFPETRSTSDDCSLCCCFCCDSIESRPPPASKAPTANSKKKKHKGFLSRLKSCFGKQSNSPSSSPTGNQPKLENVPPEGDKQGGRYPMPNDNRFEFRRPDYKNASRGNVVDGKLSVPVK